jgi:nitrogen fixation/metabolism regulation signal transduction histidine kinase
VNPLSHERRLQGLALASALPALFLAAGLAWRTHRALPWILLALAVLFTRLALSRLHRQAQRPLQTLSNLLAALRSGDYSFRAREAPVVDALGTVYQELNTFSELLRQQRLKATEASALLRTVMEEIDVAIFAFDEAGVLRLVNRAGGALLALPEERLLGRPARDLGLGEALGGNGLVDLAFPGRAGRFEVRLGSFRQGGRPHQLLVLSDLTRPLREEERKVWHGLIRVLGHEINNSLAPIQSLSESLLRILEAQGEDWMDDARQGLAIIATRAQGLGRFMEGYTRLARLPEPRKTPVELAPLLERVARLEQRLPVQVAAPRGVTLAVDGDQLAQALINLVKNAVEATLDKGGRVALRLVEAGGAVEIRVEDEGVGLPTGGNLFVPFFTTKAGGSGIGLLLSRQIAENHGGTLHLAPREDGPGTRAVLRLPWTP